MSLAAASHQSVNPKQPSDLEVLSHYLEKGAFPPGTNLTKRAFSKQFNRLNRRPSTAFSQLMVETCQKQLPLQRLVSTFSDKQLVKAYDTIIAVDGDQLSRLLAELKAIGHVLNWEKQTLRMLFWRTVGHWSMSNFEGKDLQNIVLERVVWALGVEGRLLLQQQLDHYPILRKWKDARYGDGPEMHWRYQQFLREMEHLTERDPETPKLYSVLRQFIEEQDTKITEPQKRLAFFLASTQVINALVSVNKARTIATDELDVQSDAPEVEQANPFEDTEQQVEDGALRSSDLAIARIPHNAIKEAITRNESTGQDQSTGPTELTQDVHQQVEQLRSLMNELKQARPRPLGIFKPDPFDEADFIGVFNAGLVIFWPFLGRLFENLELMSDKAFVSQEAAHKAVQVLFYLETGEEVSGFEALMVLGKVLCGLEISEPLMPIVLDQEEQEIIDGMLEAVLAKGPLWKNLTVDSLRAAYLQREGLLKTRDGVWLLQVKRETHDITLERLPWSFQVVKLPWMSAALQVEWV